VGRRARAPRHAEAVPDRSRGGAPLGRWRRRARKADHRPARCIAAIGFCLCAIDEVQAVMRPGLLDLPALGPFTHRGNGCWFVVGQIFRKPVRDCSLTTPLTPLHKWGKLRGHIIGSTERIFGIGASGPCYCANRLMLRSLPGLVSRTLQFGLECRVLGRVQTATYDRQDRGEVPAKKRRRVQP
jgi:hypothetical protein